jgi:hypothetical protein
LNVTIKEEPSDVGPSEEEEEEKKSDTIFGFISAFSALMVLMFLMI